MPTSLGSEVLRARGAVGYAVQRRNPEAEAIARRNLAAAKLAAYVQRVVDEAPPLTAEQMDRITALLQGAVR